MYASEYSIYGNVRKLVNRDKFWNQYLLVVTEVMVIGGNSKAFGQVFVAPTIIINGESGRYRVKCRNLITTNLKRGCITGHAETTSPQLGSGLTISVQISPWVEIV